MAVTLRGSAEYRARLRAIRTVFKPIGKEWADTTADIAKGMVPVRTGTLRKSIRRRNSTLKNATVVANFTAFFVDSGAKHHSITRKAGNLAWSDGGRTVFARRVDHPGQRPQPFRQRASSEGLRRTEMAEEIIKLWNSAKAAT